MAEASKLPKVKPGSRKRGWGWRPTFIVAFFIVIIAFVVLGLSGPISGSENHGKSCATMETAWQIAFALHQWAVDHNGNYPTGRSSTEIFQKLMDGGYVNDPYIFEGGYPHSNEVALTDSTQKLKPEDVGFDVTVPIDASSPDNLPVVFLTGYKIIYSAGASALPLSSEVKDRIPCMAVAYKDMTATYFGRNNFLRNYITRGYAPQFVGENDLGPGALSDGTIPNFMPTDFDPKGRIYHQLTPEGEFSP